MHDRSEASRLTTYVTHRLPLYIEQLRALCAIESPSGYSRGIDTMCSWIEAWCAGRRWEVRRHSDPDAGDNVIVRLRGKPNGTRILLAAHMDTVYPVGVVAARPFVQETDIILAPGVADNKSGLLSGLYAMAALDDLDLLSTVGEITLVCGSDEETDMRVSLQILESAARSHDLALVLEAGRENGDIVNSRKTSAHYVLEVEGREAHAGVEPDKGANAVWAIAHHIVELQELHGSRPGLTLSVGVVEGGTRVNVVPGYARAEIDVRAVREADLAPVAEAIAKIVASNRVLGTRALLRGGWKAPPMPVTPEIQALSTLAEVCGRELGIELQAAATGGVSFANYLAGFGLPVLDGLGPVGGLDHSPQEYIETDSIVPRTALLALLMIRQATVPPPPESGAG